MSSHVFGPVPSRRLGRSLGIDLVPFKTCTYDCIYCQLGPTTNKTLHRKTWIPLDLVLEELEQRLATLEGLIAFRRRFPKPFWLEVFVLGGYTDSERELADIRRCVELVQPDRVQLNTVTRPPAENWAVAVPRARLEEIAATFSPPAEVIAEFHTERVLKAGEASREEILHLLRRRPCSIEDVVGGLGLHRNEVLKSVEHLTAEGLVEERRLGGRCYYKAAEQHS
jgi:wyosine [tRNA(Phe)-imidazoG37] synthetase (radical SAM superfamily)